MNRFLILVATSLAISGCQLPQISLLPSQPPAPLAQTTIDDRALQAAWRTFDTALDAINLYMDAKPNVIGTPGATRLANAIDAVSHALTAAEKAASAGSATDYSTAIAEAKGALTEMRSAISALKGQ